MQINIEEAMWSAKNWSNFPSKVHSLYLMSGGTLSSKTRPRAGPSSLQGACDTWDGHRDLGTADPTQRAATGALGAFLRVPILPVSCPKPCAPAQQSRGAMDGQDAPAGGGDLSRSAEHTMLRNKELGCGWNCSKSFFRYGHGGPWPTPASPV